MEKRRTLFDYLGQVFMLFGWIIFILNIFCRIFGESARGYSTMFVLGNEGLSVDIMLQFFFVAVSIVIIRYLFFTDAIIKALSITKRTIGMIISTMSIITTFIITFHWFPIDQWQPWALFFLCFIISFFFSVLIITWKERIENKKMEEALKKLKESKGRIK